jgi:xanthine dehydrogenase/oxidase
VAGNSTETIVNAPSTAASTGFDLNGGAVALACRTLRARLERFFEQRAKKGQTNEVAKWRQNWREAWPEIVAEAWTDRVALSAVELYAAPHHDEPRDRFPTGRFFAYFTYSFSVSEVEIDVLTGEHIVLRTDILYDAGRSSNPAIDIGQIEGGFVQGLGFVTTEEMIYDEAGRPVTDNIWTYKPPCTKSIPLDLRVTLASPNPALMALQEQARLVAVQGTKSATEPCLSLGNSVYFAIKHAVMDARRELTGRDDWLRLDVPATCQRIQQSCGVRPEHLTLARE